MLHTAQTCMLLNSREQQDRATDQQRGTAYLILLAKSSVFVGMPIPNAECSVVPARGKTCSTGQYLAIFKSSNLKCINERVYVLSTWKQVQLCNMLYGPRKVQISCKNQHT